MHCCYNLIRGTSIFCGFNCRLAIHFGVQGANLFIKTTDLKVHGCHSLAARKIDFLLWRTLVLRTSSGEETEMSLDPRPIHINRVALYS